MEWVHPPLPLAHPLDGGRAATLHRDVDETAAGLGADAAAYRRTFGPLVDERRRSRRHVPRAARPARTRPVAGARFGLHAIRSAQGFADARFDERRGAGDPRRRRPRTRSNRSRRRPPPGTGSSCSCSPTRTDGPSHAAGARAWPTRSAAVLRAHGGEIVTGHEVTDLGALPRAPVDDARRDTAPAAARSRVTASRRATRRRLRRFRYGPGVCKVDWALSEPIPWAHTSARGRRHRARRRHRGRDHRVRGRGPRRPAPRPSVRDRRAADADGPDAARRPAGHVAWAYCHVPERRPPTTAPTAIEAHIERFAPGFRDVVTARHTMTAPADGASRRQLRRRRHQRRRRRPPPAVHPARGVAPPVGDAAGRRVPVLVVDAARWGRARHVRAARGPPRAAPHPLTGCNLRCGYPGDPITSRNGAPASAAATTSRPGRRRSRPSRPTSWACTRRIRRRCSSPRAARVRGLHARRRSSGALYEDRTLLRMLGMRRTMFVVDPELGAVMDAACTQALVAGRAAPAHRAARGPGHRTRRRTAGSAACPTAPSPRSRHSGTATASELTKVVPELREKLVMGEGKKWGGDRRRLDARPVPARHRRADRARPAAWPVDSRASTNGRRCAPGSTRCRTTTRSDARAALLRRWLRTYGPATLRDITWWTGWTQAQGRAALGGPRRGRGRARRRHGVRAAGRHRAGAPPATLGGAAPRARPDGDGLEGAGLVPRAAHDAAVRPERQRGTHGLGRRSHRGRLGPASAMARGGRAARAGGGDRGRGRSTARSRTLTEWLAGTVVTPRFRTPMERDIATR